MCLCMQKPAAPDGLKALHLCNNRNCQQTIASSTSLEARIQDNTWTPIEERKHTVKVQDRGRKLFT